MKKASSEQPRKRVLARILATVELNGVSGGDDTTWTDGPLRKDFTQVSAGDVPGDPPSG